MDEGRKIVTVSGNRLINLWDLKTGECLQTFPSESLPCPRGTSMIQQGTWTVCLHVFCVPAACNKVAACCALAEDGGISLASATLPPILCQLDS